MKRPLPLALGILALLSTIALICDCIVLAVYISSESLVRTTSLLSASLETIVWIMLSWFTSTTVSNSLASLLRRSSTRNLTTSFGCAIMACVLAAATSIANLVCLDNARPSETSRADKGAFLIASSAVLGITFTCQVTFLVVHCIVCRRSIAGAGSLHVNNDFRLSPKSRVRTVPYSRTRPSMADNLGTTSMESVNMNSLDSKRSPAHSTSSPQSSMSPSIQPSSSRARLLTIKEKQGLASPNSGAWRNNVDDGETWDASSGFSRHTAQDGPPAVPLKPRVLETIPASLVVTQSPSFDSVADLEPPAPIRPRGRSYTPTTRSPRQRTQSPNITSGDELNIHPLFRSDLPTPPPVASPGTSVVAAPNAGKVITQRPSNQSLRRVRSCSLASTSSPLSRRSSFEAQSLKRAVDEKDSILEVDEEDEETETEEMASPIPDFVMSAGSRSSLTRYKSKKQGPEDEETTRAPA